jgi:hypothetical protein
MIKNSALSKHEIQYRIFIGFFFVGKFFLPGFGSRSGFSIRIPSTDPETQLNPDPTGFGSETLVTSKII